MNINDFLYSQDEKSLIGALQAEVSDITIYIEDTAEGMRNFYKKLLEKKFPNISIDNIIPLGKKTEVIKYCNQKTNNLRELYVIDGDLDIFLCKKIKRKFLFQHNVYCIENYLFNEDAVANLLSNESGKMDDINIIKQALEMDNFFDEIFGFFIDIYILFAISYKNGLDIPTVNSFDDSIYLHRNKNYTVINTEKMSTKYNNLKNEIIEKIGISKFNTDFNSLNQYKEGFTVQDYRKIISGKNELLYLLKGYAQHIVKNFDPNCKHIMQLSHSSMKVKLAAHTNHDNLSEFFNAIEQTINHGYYSEAS
ncbi:MULTISPECIES: DUF4435 domain-containing protein [unclassified Acinetobacter]|uniref:DUF4435 domain-containing protein n=1 Tax=unclassified Acinetobacter TaxID=196816 RepID=UPI0015D334EC|nr:MULTISPECIES: DUF4435 domain-containing protein [unclassified Acinetobacter]UUS56857.1 DUF4435 domain-containing protein [Acinetobacter sp. YH16040_T]